MAIILKKFKCNKKHKQKCNHKITKPYIFRDRIKNLNKSTTEKYEQLGETTNYYIKEITL